MTTETGESFCVRILSTISLFIEQLSLPVLVFRVELVMYTSTVDEVNVIRACDAGYVLVDEAR